MSDDLAARRAQGQMVCLRCGGFSSARYCYGCSAAVVFEDAMREQWDQERRARQAAEARAARLAAALAEIMGIDIGPCDPAWGEPCTNCAACLARQALAEEA